MAINKEFTVGIVKEKRVIEEDVDRFHGGVDGKEAGKYGIDIIRDDCIIKHSDVFKREIWLCYFIVKGVSGEVSQGEDDVVLIVLKETVGYNDLQSIDKL